MKDFSRLLQKGNLTPKERVLLLIANTLNQGRGEKGFLSKADIYSLSEGWTPANNDEVREYNCYSQGWKIACYIEIDAQTHYLKAKLIYQSMQVLLSSFRQFPIYSEVEQALDRLATIKWVGAKEAIEIINKQRDEKLKRGLLPLEKAIYELAFELIGEETKKKLLELHQDAEYDRAWLDEEQEFVELYKTKDFEGIAERVSKKCYNAYTKEYQLFNNYACIPIEEIAKRYAKENNLPFENTADERKELKAENALLAIEKLSETLEQDAKDKQTTVEEIIKQACLKWINEGLLEKDHTPLFICDPELLNKCLETEEKARLILRDLISKGTLKIEDEMITGESLYNCGLDYAFIEDYKDYIDEYSPDLGLVNGDDGEYLDRKLLISQEKTFPIDTMHFEWARNLSKLDTLSILKEREEADGIVVDIKNEKLKRLLMDTRDDFIKRYKVLLAFEGLLKRLSKVFEIDLTYRINLWTTDCKELIDDFNETLSEALTTVKLDFSQQAGKKKHYKSNELFIDTDKIKPNNLFVEKYKEEFVKILGDEF